MAAIAPNMGLKVWNLLTDPYDHAQLASNWAKVDQHDHSTGKGVQIPTGGIADGAISAAKIGEDQVTDSKILKAPVRGIVTNEGEAAGGSGFTVAKTGTGLYTVTFTPALPSVPVAVAMILNNVGFITVETTEVTKIKVKTYNTSIILANQYFFFIAYPS